MDEDNEDQQPPQGVDDEHQRHFDRTIQRLENNEIKGHFRLADATGGRRMTISQAKTLALALQKNTSVEGFKFYLHECPLPAMSLFIDYVRSSPRLKEVTAPYRSAAFDAENPMIQQRYKAQLDSLFQAVGDNPSIENMNVQSFGSSPTSVYDLFVNTKSLKKLEIVQSSISENEALSVMAGISRNSSLRDVYLRINNGPVHLILSGIGASSVESVNIAHLDGHSAWKGVSIMLLSTPSLKSLTVTESRWATIQGQNPSSFLSALCHPACASLQELELVDVELCAQGVDTKHVDNPAKQSNASLLKLDLTRVHFQSPSAVRLLWSAIGLEELNIYYYSSRRHPSDMEGESQLESWAEFVRRNKKMRKVALCVDHAMYYPLAHGVLEGLRMHKSLVDLTIVAVQLGEEFGERLRQILHETPSLKILVFDDVTLEPSCTALLAEGIVQNRSLQKLDFDQCRAGLRFVTEILESLLLNQTLEHLAFKSLESSDVFGVTASNAISQVIRVNTSLTALTVPLMDFSSDEAAISEILISLQENKTLKSLIFDDCNLDDDVLNAVGRALESNDVVVTEIGLCASDETPESIGNVDDVTEDGRRALVRSLERMPKVRTVRFGESLKDMDGETRGLLLHAVRQNSNIYGLYHYEYESTNPTRVATPAILSVETEIKYYLELNEFGRCILDSPNVIPSLWPMILSRMTNKPQNAGALFYFVREYFSRQQPQPQHLSEPLRKKARVD